MSRRIIVMGSLAAVLLMYCNCSGSGAVVPSIENRESTEFPQGITSSAVAEMTRLDPTGIYIDGNSANRPQYLEGEVLVVLRDGINPGSLFPLTQEMGLSLIKEVRLMWGTVYRMRINSGEAVESMVSRLRKSPEVKYAEPNLIPYPCSVPYYPNDPLFETELDADDDPWNSIYDQWGPNAIGASLCWPEYKGDPDVIVAVIDSGVRYTHEDLANQIWINEDEIPGNGVDDDGNDYIDDWRGWDFGSDDNDPWDYHGHGTGWTGVVVAEQDNDAGCTGIAPGCRMMAAVCGNGSTGLLGIAEAVQYAYDNGASVVSMSFGFPLPSDIFENTIEATYDNGNGIIFVASAGNSDAPALSYPARLSEIVGVGASASFLNNGQRCEVTRVTSDVYGWGSNYGEDLEILAPGIHYLSTHVDGDDQYWDGINNMFFGGTSCSTPCSAGCFALLRSAHPEMTAGELRLRINRTCDDLHEPGWDPQTGWGRVNIWRAVYGSEPNESVYDVNGHIPANCDDIWQYDNVFDIPGYVDYDTVDVFVIEADGNGVIQIDLDIITTGENLDMDLYLTPDLLEPVGISTGPNDRFKPGETIACEASQGQMFYLRVFSPAPGNCSNYRIRCRTQPVEWWMEYESLAPPFVYQGSSALLLLKMEIHTSTEITVPRLQAYIIGDAPLDIVNYVRLYHDTNDSGELETDEDTLIGTINPSDGGTNQVTFGNLNAECKYSEPLRYWLVANVGPNDLGYNVRAGIGLRSYKDIPVLEDVPLREDPFPIFSGLTIIGTESDPPEWDTTVGVQYVVPKWQGAILYWNNATDLYSEPTSYNAYWDDVFPPQISMDKMIEGIETGDGGDYEHMGKVSGFENDQEYYFCVRAVDALGNEEENEIWLPCTPGPFPDPTAPQVIGSYNPDQGDYKDVVVLDKIAFVASCTKTGIAVIDCNVVETPVLIDFFNTSNGCRRIEFYDDQNLIYVATTNGLLIINPDPPNDMSIVGSYLGINCYALFVSGGNCFLGASSDLYILDISVPESPQLKGQVWCESWIRDIAVQDDYVFCCTYGKGLKIVDANDTANPVLVDTVLPDYRTVRIQLWQDSALVISHTPSAFSVIDVSNALNASLIGEMNTFPMYANCFAVLDDQYVYLGHYSGDYEVWSVDWSNADNMYKSGSCTVHNAVGMYFDGEFLYVADSADGLKIML